MHSCNNAALECLRRSGASLSAPLSPTKEVKKQNKDKAKQVREEKERRKRGGREEEERKRGEEVPRHATSSSQQDLFN